MRSLLAAVAFLTRLPVGRLIDFDSEDVSRSAAWFPLAGALIGAISAGTAYLLRSHLPAALVGVLLVAIDAIVTGGLHYDGLADTADGFGGGKSREDVLRIMRDHAVGSYGALAIACIVALKATAYTALIGSEHWAEALVLTPALGRWSILLLTAALPYARTTPSVTKGMGKRSLAWGTLILLIGLYDAATLGTRGIAAAPIGVAAVTSLVGLYCHRRIGGVTGDTLGANVQLSEAVVLMIFLWG